MQVLILALLGGFCLGWTVLLGFGIYRMRRKLAGGLVMTILGAIWALPAIALAALVGLAFYSYTTWETSGDEMLVLHRAGRGEALVHRG